MDPAKLAAFSKGNLVPAVTNKYLQHIIDEEMPWGLKKYMEIELFPHLHLKPGKGISLSTAHCWLHSKGFQYIGHKKGLYFDGHDQPDVIDYRQNEFLPAMAKYSEWMVHVTPVTSCHNYVTPTSRPVTPRSRHSLQMSKR